MNQSPEWDARFGIVPLEDCLPHLAKSSSVKKALERRFGKGAARLALPMMEQGALSGDLGDEVHDFLADLIRNEAEHARQYWALGDFGRFPVDVRGYEGIFFVHPLEQDAVEYFLSVEDACSYVEGMGFNLVPEEG